MFFGLNFGNGLMFVEVFIVSKMDGVSRFGDLGFDDIGSSGLLFIMVDIFVMKVIKILWVSLIWFWSNIELSILCDIFIKCFYVFFMWEVWGGLNI